MRSKRYRFWSHDNRFRLMLTLGLAVLLPAAALIYVNFHHLKSIERDKKVEAIIHRDFQYVLAVSEKRLNQKAYTMTEEVRSSFPSPDNDTEPEKERSSTSSCQRIPGWRTCFSSIVKRASCSVRNRSRWATSTSVRSMSAWRKVTVVVRHGRQDAGGRNAQEEPAHHLVHRSRKAGRRATLTLTTAFFVLPQALQRPGRDRRRQLRSRNI